MLTMASVAWSWGGSNGSMEDGAIPMTDEERWALAREYAPMFIFSVKERTFPSPVGYFLERSNLVDHAGTRVLERPGPDDLARASPLLFLDNVMGQGSDQGVIERYEVERGLLDPTVYVHLVEGGGMVAVQYWLFYVFNHGNYNSHEGDWEMVQVVLDRETLTPQWMMLSHHHSQGHIEWENGIAVVNATHPMVLVARGSHANYPAGHASPMAGDEIDGLGETWSPDEYSLSPIGPEWEGEVPGWLLFGGYWGEPAGAWGGLMGREGPPGPMFREQGTMWNGLDRS